MVGPVQLQHVEVRIFATVEAVSEMLVTVSGHEVWREQVDKIVIVRERGNRCRVRYPKTNG